MQQASSFFTLEIQILTMKKTLTLLLCVCLCIAANAQFALKQLKDKVLKSDPLSNLLKSPPPITTNFKDDVNMDGSLPETFGEDKTFLKLSSLQRAVNGGFLLAPGFYEMTNRSYCLKAGTYGPSKGDGYMYAPVKGPQDDVVIAILRNSLNHLEIPQSEVQLLLWAIIARAKFENLSTKSKAVAALLLTPKQIAMLNRNALEFISETALKSGAVDMPPALQKVLEAENKLRSMFAEGIGTFEEFERIAVLAGMAPIDNSGVKRGMWSRHPDGYFIRYLPSGYSTTTVQLWVEDGSPAVGKEYDPSIHIACPANTGAQRLAQSGIEKKI